jgi:predicted AAA+ superfamily ATPase
VGERDIGSYFENYVYLKLRSNKQVYYLQEQGVEIDFYTDDQMLIETKYYSKMNSGQEKLFAGFPAKQKLVLDSIEKLELL